VKALNVWRHQSANQRPGRDPQSAVRQVPASSEQLVYIYFANQNNDDGKNNNNNKATTCFSFSLRGYSFVILTKQTFDSGFQRLAQDVLILFQ